MDSKVITSAKTAIKNHKPALFRLASWKTGTINVDVGAGRTDWPTRYLKAKGVRNLSYDPYNLDERINIKALTYLGKADTVTISNVLNVIEKKKDIRACLSLASKLLKPGGLCYVRIYPGNATGKGRVSADGLCFQHNKRSGWYIPLLKEVFRDVDTRPGFIVASNKT